MFSYLRTPLPLLSSISVLPKHPTEMILGFPLAALDHETLELLAQEICERASEANITTAVRISCVYRATKSRIDGVAMIEMPMRWLNPAQLSELRRAANRLSR